MGGDLFSQVQRDQNVKLGTQFCLLLRVKICGTLLPLFCTSSWHSALGTGTIVIVSDNTLIRALLFVFSLSFHTSLKLPLVYKLTVYYTELF
jgi:hypothetical protein